MTIRELTALLCTLVNLGMIVLLTSCACIATCRADAMEASTTRMSVNETTDISTQENTLPFSNSTFIISEGLSTNMIEESRHTIIPTVDTPTRITRDVVNSTEDIPTPGSGYTTARTAGIPTGDSFNFTEDIPTPMSGDATIPTMHHTASIAKQVTNAAAELPTHVNELITQASATAMTSTPFTPPFELQTGTMQQPVIQTHTTHPPSNVGSGLANPRPLEPPEPPMFWMPPTNDTIHGKNEAVTVTDENNLELYGNVRFVVSTYKYAIPIVAGLLIIPTAGFMYVICKQMRTATAMNRASCSLMLAIAVAYILCIAVSISEFGYMYSVSRTNHDYLPLSSCSTMSVLERLSAIPHTASIWLTVALSVQRYLCVAKPFVAKSHFTTAKSAIIITFSYTLAIIMHVCRFFDVHFVAIILRINSFSNLSEIVETCHIQYASWIQQPILYEALFSWCRVSFVQLIPCALLIVFTLGLIRALSVSNRSLKAMKIVDSNRQKQRRSLSIAVLLISGIVCAVESSMGIVLCLNSIRISTGINFVAYETVKVALIGIDIGVYLSYFFIFSIYCFMSHGIRDKVRNMVCKLSGTCTKRQHIALKQTETVKTFTPYCVNTTEESSASPQLSDEASL